MRKMLAAAAALGLAWAAPALAVEPKNPVEIEEWTVPWADTRPRDPDAESAKRVWFVGQVGHYLARLDSESGEFTRFPLDDEPGPHNLVVGADGVVWYAGNLEGYIGRFEPFTETIERIEMPDAAAEDPHTLVFDNGQRNIWFTVQGGNFVGRLNVATREVKLAAVPTADARPYGITVAPNGKPWVALFGTNKLAKVDPFEMEVSEHPLPASDARPRRIDVTATGDLYYTDYARGRLGRLDPGSGETREWLMPSGEDSRPYAMVVDGRDRVWFVETGPQPNNLVGFDPAEESFFSVTPIPSGGGAVRNMDYHGPTKTLWFGTDANTIGRARVD